MKITILSDNYVSSSMGLLAEHGFSVHIERDGKSYLFDTGQHGVCVDNAQTLGINLSGLEKIMLSHGHYDHIGGLAKVLKTIGKEIEVVGHPAIFDKKFAVTEQFGKKFIGLVSDRTYLEDNLGGKFNLQSSVYEIAPGMWLTGEVPFTNDVEIVSGYLQVEQDGILHHDTIVDDNSLIIDTHDGLLVIFGCAHRGVVNILSYVKKTFNKPIYGVIGGTHLMGVEQDHFNFVKDFLLGENIQFFGPSHCTGIHNIMKFAHKYKAITRPAFCASRFEFN